MRCVIFGGGGFIGSAIADRLLCGGHELRIFERSGVLPYRDFVGDERVEWVTGDFLNASDIGRAISGMDVVLHLVSTTLPKSSSDDPIFDVQTNIVASLQVLNSMVDQKVPRIVFISSGGTVYGNPVELPVTENHPTNPQVSYGITKLAIEKYLLLYQQLHGIKATVLRVANPYGQRQRVETAQGAVGVFLARALENKSIDIWGDGSVTRDYIHVSDVAEAFAKAVEYNGGKSIFNISSGAGISLNDLVDALEGVLGKSIERNYLPSRPFDVPVNVICNALAEQELGWRPAVAFKDGLSLTAEWMRKSVPQ